MKVVINRCFGGFGLSEEAFELLLNKKGIEFEKVPAKHPIGMSKFSYYTKGYVGEDDHFLWDSGLCQDRSDVDLVAVVEELGDKANGWAAELAIVEIPDDVKWHIDEYDGSEHVAEDHRTWR
jgi:hypothetical protein